MDVFEKLNKGIYRRTWKSKSPFHLGCGYGSSSTMGDEKKFTKCYSSFYGVGDIDFWIMEEVNKLSKEEQDEMLSMIKRNEKIDKFITLKKVEVLCEQVGYESDQSHYIYRLGNKHINNLLNSKNPKELHTQILDGIHFDPITLQRKDYKPPRVFTEEDWCNLFDEPTQ